MAQPYVGEIRIFAGTFAPLEWAFCDGSLLPIDQYDALFNLFGTTFGGDGQIMFALPDLRGRVPMHSGPSYTLGQSGGLEKVPLALSQIPAHTHVPVAQAAGGSHSSPA